MFILNDSKSDVTDEAVEWAILVCMWVRLTPSTVSEHCGYMIKTLHRAYLPRRAFPPILLYIRYAKCSPCRRTIADRVCVGILEPCNTMKLTLDHKDVIRHWVSCLLIFNASIAAKKNPTDGPAPLEGAGTLDDEKEALISKPAPILTESDAYGHFSRLIGTWLVRTI